MPNTSLILMEALYILILYVYKNVINGHTQFLTSYFSPLPLQYKKLQKNNEPLWLKH